MATWKKIIVSGSSISQLANDANLIYSNSADVALTGSYSGSFTGDGSGLTNLGVSTITDALVELSGVPAGSVGLGTFEKGIINDNVGIKSALQDLELSSAETSTAAKINNYEWSNNNDNTIGQTQITTDATNWADATKIYVHRRAKNNVDMQNVFNNTLVRGAKVYIQKTNDATKAFTAHISSDSPIVTGTGTNQVFEYSVIDVSTTGTVFNDGITLNFGIYVDTNTYQVGLATAGLASIVYVNSAISAIGTASTVGLASIEYVDDAIIGFATVAYVDLRDNEVLNDVQNNLNTNYYTAGQVDNIVGLATAGITTAGFATIAYVGLATAGLASITYVNQQVANSVAGLASTEYVDTTVGLATIGLLNESSVIGIVSTALFDYATEQYVDNAVSGISTEGLASIAYVDTVEQDIINQVGSLLNLSYYTKTQVDTNIGIATAGLASTEYVDNASTTTWTLGANGISDYTFTGIGFTQTTNDPDLYLARGQVYNFSNEMGAHPFQIQDTQNGTVGTPYNNGVTNNGASNGTVRFEVPFNAPDTLYYQCTAHTGMGGTIFIYPTLR